MLMIDDLNALTDFHSKNCKIYADYIESFFTNSLSQKLEELPFVPVRAFKNFDLYSISDDQIYKIMMSSGTSGSQSKIVLDKHTAKNQTNALIEIFGENFGKARYPMLIIDAESTVKNRQRFSARTAAINGFSMFSRKQCFALDDDMKLNHKRVISFLEHHANETIFVFGFTSLIWNALINREQDLKEKLNLERSFILHGGGWKKLEHEKVSAKKFNELLLQKTGCKVVRNYYGMVEQTGSIFVECSSGNLHASRFSDVLCRDINTLEVLPEGEVGVIQLFSTLPRSYPGHSLLTEDIGRVYSGTKCNCSKKGSILDIHGRAVEAEVRGCSDAYR